MKKEKLKKIFETINSHNTYVSILALIVSVFSLTKSYSLQEKNSRFNTYSMDLCYSIEFSEDINECDITYEDKGMLVISSKDLMSLVPRVGGIYKVSTFFNQSKEDFVFGSSVNIISDIVNISEAQDTIVTLENLPLMIDVMDDDKYYCSVFLLIEDYKHNFYTNMIILEVDKKNLAYIDVRVYGEVDLLYTYNEDDDYIDEFDYQQMKKYLKLKKQLDKVLKNI